MKITRVGTTPSMAGPTNWFTGTVRVDALFPADGGRQVNAATVTFDPGARTNWHTHPLGQTILITQGLGWAQRHGGPREDVRPGDVVFFEPGEKHWHGASATTAMCHIAIQESLEGRSVDWLDPVSDEDYGQWHQSS